MTSPGQLKLCEIRLLFARSLGQVRKSLQSLLSLSHNYILPCRPSEAIWLQIHVLFFPKGIPSSLMFFHLFARSQLDRGNVLVHRSRIKTPTITYAHSHIRATPIGCGEHGSEGPQTGSIKLHVQPQTLTFHRHKRAAATRTLQKHGYTTLQQFELAHHSAERMRCRSLRVTPELVSQRPRPLQHHKEASAHRAAVGPD